MLQMIVNIPRSDTFAVFLYFFVSYIENKPELEYNITYV